jgi:hypothetical protein
MIPNNRNLPNFAQDLVRIHKVITRGLNVGVTRGKEFLDVGFPNQGIQRGFADYIQSLRSVLSAHHLGEDEIAFPALKEKLPAAPYGRLAEDHKIIEAALTLVKASISEVAGANPAAGLGVVMDALKKILRMWTPHMGKEEKFFAERAIGEVMTPDEQAGLSGSMSKLSQVHAVPPFLVLPFVLFNLDGADREAMAATLPEVVIKQLLPIDWKEQWSAMRPFLLD